MAGQIVQSQCQEQNHFVRPTQVKTIQRSLQNLQSRYKPNSFFILCLLKIPA